MIKFSRKIKSVIAKAMVGVATLAMVAGMMPAVEAKADDYTVSVSTISKTNLDVTTTPNTDNFNITLTANQATKKIKSATVYFKSVSGGADLVGSYTGAAQNRIDVTVNATGANYGEYILYKVETISDGNDTYNIYDSSVSSYTNPGYPYYNNAYYLTPIFSNGFPYGTNVDPYYYYLYANNAGKSSVYQNLSAFKVSVVNKNVDKTAPFLFNLEVEKKAATRSFAERIDVYVYASDDFNSNTESPEGIAAANVEFVNENGDVVTVGVGWQVNTNFLYGNAATASMKPGKYSVNKVTLADKAGNVAIYEDDSNYASYLRGTSLVTMKNVFKDVSFTIGEAATQATTQPTTQAPTQAPTEAATAVQLSPSTSGPATSSPVTNAPATSGDATEKSPQMGAESAPMMAVAMLAVVMMLGTAGVMTVASKRR